MQKKRVLSSEETGTENAKKQQHSPVAVVQTELEISTGAGGYSQSPTAAHCTQWLRLALSSEGTLLKGPPQPPPGPLGVCYSSFDLSIHGDKKKINKDRSA